MEQIGTVKQISGKTAVVEVLRISACGENCAHCKGGCTPSSVHATVENRCGAKPGDRVKIVTDDKGVLKAAALLYLVPLVLAVIGAVVCYSVFNQSAAAVVSFVAVLLVSFLVIHKLDRKLAPTSEIVKIVGKEGQV